MVLSPPHRCGDTAQHGDRAHLALAQPAGIAPLANAPLLVALALVTGGPWLWGYHTGEGQRLGGDPNREHGVVPSPGHSPRHGSPRSGSPT